MASAPELRELLRAALRERLRDDGWTELEFEGRLSVVELAHPIDEDFIAIAAIGRAAITPDRPPVLITDVNAAVGYLPLRRLWPLLGEPWLEPRIECALRDPGDGGEPEPWPIASVGDLEAVGDRVATLVGDEVLAFATEHASVEAMLAWFDDLDGPDHYRALSLLAAAGRLDEARARLESFDAERGYPNMSDGGGQRFARQLRRWIDSGGDPRLRTDSSPPPRYDLRVESVAAMWSSARDEDDAVQAIRRVAAGRSRDELRALLEAELAKRNLSETPIWIEQTLDTLSLSRTEQWQRTGELLGRIGTGLIQAIRDRGLPDLSVPDWLAPPSRAAYAVPRNRDRPRTAVLLDPDARDWLDDIHDALPKLLDNPVEFDAWLDSDTPDGDALAVYVGQRRVGMLDQRATAAFTAVMRAAAERDERPTTAAAIRRLGDGGYMLELQLPKPE
jgi:hypothetical protein